MGNDIGSGVSFKSVCFPILVQGCSKVPGDVSPVSLVLLQPGVLTLTFREKTGAL